MRKPDALRGKIVKAAKPAAFLDFIMALPDSLIAGAPSTMPESIRMIHSPPSVRVRRYA